MNKIEGDLESHSSLLLYLALISSVHPASQQNFVLWQVYTYHFFIFILAQINKTLKISLAAGSSSFFKEGDS